MITETAGRQALSADEICVVTPTKGRHRQLGFLLETLSRQTTPVGHVIIADGGRDASDVVGRYSDVLPVTWLDCPEPGQIVQRNLALAHLPAKARVVIYFDDDIQLEPDAIEVLVAFWNRQAREPAGVSFNITNMPEQPDSPFRHIFSMASRPFGKVWRSGYNSPISGIDEDMRSEWLIGGATAWRRSILETYRLADLPSVWAVCEDLMFSFPVSRTEQLFVCAAARVHHIDDVPALSYEKARARGKSGILWRYYFVSQNPELSRGLFFWMNTGQILGRALRVLKGGPAERGFLSGTIAGVGLCLRAFLAGRSIRDELR